MKVQDWLGQDNELGVSIYERKYQNDGETFDQWLDRVSGGEEKVKKLIVEKKFLPGGRILASRGLAGKDGKKITYSNCFSGDTKILTDNGIKSLYELAGKTTKVLSYGKWRNAEIKSFGTQGIRLLHIHKGKVSKTIKVTGDHIWLVNDKSGKYAEIRTEDLKAGMKLANSTTKCYRKYKPSPFGVAHGFHFGDGDHVDKKTLRTNICKGKEELIPYFTPDNIGESGEALTVCGVPHFFNYPPKLDESPSYLYGWLAGYFAADGSVDERGACTMSSTKIENLQAVQNVLCVLGLPVGIIRQQERISNLTNEIGTIYILSLSRYYLNENFFILSKHRERFCNSEPKAPNQWVVDEVSDIVGNEEVFCAVEPEKNAFTLDGNILTHNCYVVAPPKDNLESIFDCAKKLARTYSYGGGCGIDLSYLSPKGAKVRNAAKESSGAVSFMDLYSMVTGLISQNGRRGALMLSIDVGHPDVEEFIDIKKDLDRVTKANTSVRMRQDFINAVINDEDYEITYTREETGETISKTIKAKELFHKIAYNNWDMGEPGVLYWDRISDWNLLSGYDDFSYAGVNPCAEEPLPAGGSCLLGSINLSAFVDRNGNFDFEELGEAVFTATVALNEILDEGLPLHPLQEQRDSVRDWRQIGLGVMGIADMLIKMGIKYGSDDSISLCSDIAYCILNSAVYASANLAAIYGKTFPKYDYDKLCKSKFFQENISEDNKKYIREHGMYNSQLLTIAPTGTLSTMLGISGGIEPIFANYYVRKTESLYGKDKEFKVYTPIVKKFMEIHSLKDDSELPDYFVASADIAPINRIRMQGAWQRYIDASISSTINLPNEATVEDVENIYLNAAKYGLKGITVFRSGCRRAGILTTESSKSNDDKAEDTSKPTALSRGFILEASDDLVGKKRKLTTGCGSLHCTAFFDPVTGDLMETYLSKGSTGGCNNFMIGLSRMISLAARGGVGIDSIIDQLSSSGTCPSYAVRSAKKHDTSRGSCCPVAIGNALKEMWLEMQQDIDCSDTDAETETAVKIANEPTKAKPVAQAKCPECGEALVHDGGCDRCPNCGWSKCQ